MWTLKTQKCFVYFLFYFVNWNFSRKLNFFGRQNLIWITTKKGSSGDLKLLWIGFDQKSMVMVMIYRWGSVARIRWRRFRPRLQTLQGVEWSGGGTAAQIRLLLPVVVVVAAAVDLSGCWRWRIVVLHRRWRPLGSSSGGSWRHRIERLCHGFRLDG